MRASLAVPTCPSPSRVKSATAEMLVVEASPLVVAALAGAFLAQRHFWTPAKV